MKRLDIKAAARAELAQIYDYSVAEFGPTVAETYLAGLRNTLDHLLEFPFMGTIYPDVIPEIRVILYRSHRVFYRIEGDKVLIVRLLHKMRDAQAVQISLQSYFIGSIIFEYYNPPKATMSKGSPLILLFSQADDLTQFDHKL